MCIYTSTLFWINLNIILILDLTKQWSITIWFLMCTLEKTGKVLLELGTTKQLIKEEDKQEDKLEL